MRRCALMLMAAVLGIAPAVRGEEEEAALPSADTWQNGPFYMLRPEVSLQFLGRYNSSTVKPAVGSAIKSRDTTLDELLGLRTRGYVVDPGFVNFNSLSGTFGLEQRWFEQEGNRDYSAGTLYEYSIDAMLLRNIQGAQSDLNDIQGPLGHQIREVPNVRPILSQ